jgi:AcrR family transcriptional regulator
MHFRDKDEILHEICYGTLKALLQQNSEFAAMPADAVTRVRLLLEAYARMGLEHPNAYHLVYCATPRVTITESPMQAATREIGAQCYECYVGVVRDIAAEGRLRVADSECAAQVLWTAVHGLVALMISRPNVEWRPADELISVMLDGLLNGLVSD